MVWEVRLKEKKKKHTTGNEQDSQHLLHSDSCLHMWHKGGTGVGGSEMEMEKLFGFIQVSDYYFFFWKKEE